MSKSIKLTRKQWDAIRDHIKGNYPLSTLLVREKMRQVLGFTDRAHDNFDFTTARYTNEVHLDFFNESKRTMFLLKYSDIIGNYESESI